MKMIKAMKKLRFWSRKKRKKYSSYDPYFDYHYQPPSTYHHSTYHYSCSSSFSAQPSAPPLPPWLEQELTHEPVCEPCWVQSVPGEQEVVYTSQTTHQGQFTCQEVLQETSPMLHHPTLPAESSSSSSHQQHMDPNPPVYGLPVVQTNSTNIEKKSSDVFGCFVRFGLNLVGCFFPCLTIREADHDRLKLHAPGQVVAQAFNHKHFECLQSSMLLKALTSLHSG